MNLTLLDREQLEDILLNPPRVEVQPLQCSDCITLDRLPRGPAERTTRIRHVLAAAHELLVRVANTALVGRSLLTSRSRCRSHRGRWLELRIFCGAWSGMTTDSFQVREHRFQKTRDHEYVCVTWFECDRQNVRLETLRGRVILDLWDDDVTDAVDSGYLTEPRVPRATDADWQPHAVAYARDTGRI